MTAWFRALFYATFAGMKLIGLDLGQTNDPSAMGAFERRDWPATPLPPLPPRLEYAGPPKPPPCRDWNQPMEDPQKAADKRFRDANQYISGNEAFDADLMASAPTIPMERRYLCRGLRKWRLGTSYVKVVEDVRALCALPRMNVDGNGVIRKPTLIIDASGLGAPVVDMFLKARVPAELIAITITGGNAIRQDKNRAYHWFVPKHILVNSLQVVLQSNRIDWPAAPMIDPITTEDMHEALTKELTDFRQDVSKAGNETFEADPGTHDDLLMACSYCCWYGEKGGRTPKAW